MCFPDGIVVAVVGCKCCCGCCRCCELVSFEVEVMIRSAADQRIWHNAFWRKIYRYKVEYIGVNMSVVSISGGACWGEFIGVGVLRGVYRGNYIGLSISG